MTWQNFKLHVTVCVAILGFVWVLTTYADGTGNNTGRLIDHPAWLLFVTLACVLFAKVGTEHLDK